MTDKPYERVPVKVGSPEWHAERRKGVTASEIAAVLGIAPPTWTSPFALYHRKIGTVPEQADNESMFWGRELEALILSRFSRNHPELTVTKGALYRSTERPWQLATPDGLAFESGIRSEIPLSSTVYDFENMNAGLYDALSERAPIATVQVKTDATTDGWGDEGTDEIPLHYRAQVLWEMDTLGVGVAYLPVLFGGRRYREYVVEYDVPVMADLRDAALEFLARVEDRDAPPVDWTPATNRALKQLHPSLQDIDVELDQKATTAVYQYLAARDAVKAFERSKAEAENVIREALGNAAGATIDGERVVSRTMFDRDYVESKPLRREHPDIFHAYSKTTTVDRLTVHKPKEVT